MAKEFNYTGTCIPTEHYMVDTSHKLVSIIALIEKGKYFSINRPRQYGKTTTIFLLNKQLQKKEGYFPISMSFEGIGSEGYENPPIFIESFLLMLRHFFSFKRLPEIADLIIKAGKINNFKQLGYLLTELILKLNKKVVLIIDEVDKSCNNQLFLDFLAMLRAKYLLSRQEEDVTFQSVILAGVHDVKTLKLKLRPDEEKKLNSPWNIAVDLTVDLAFNAKEIATMLSQYVEERGVSMDIPLIAQRLYHFTSGYPFLVSKLCYIMDTSMDKGKSAGEWTVSHLENAVKQILKENNTNFDSLIKNLENNSELYAFTESILLQDTKIAFNQHSHLIYLGVTYGIFKAGTTVVEIHNNIYRQILYNYMTTNLMIKKLIVRKIDTYNYSSNFILPDNKLDFEKVLTRFQAFMREQYSKKDDSFVEANWRLLYLAFLKPIINGHGYDFKEAQVSEEKRLDVVTTYYNHRYITELKIWYGQKKHEAGLLQLVDYLDRQSIDKGYLVIFDFRKEMDYKSEWVTVEGKEVFCVWV